MAPSYLSLVLPTLLLVLLLVTTVAAKVPAVIVFGDSSVDAGNNNQIPTVARSNFEPYGRDFTGGKPTGRFSNGRIATDFISKSLGLKPTIPAYLDPSYNISDFATGVTFASAAAGYDTATSDVLSVISLWKQLDYYKEYQTKLRAFQGVNEANKTINQALYMMSLGTNDFLENYYTTYPPSARSSQYTASQYQDFLIGIAGNFVKELYKLGARKISVGGLPPMGCLPLERTRNFMGGSECMSNYNDVALQFNSKLTNLTVSLNKDLPGSTVVFANPYFIFQNMIRKPSKYGFEVTSTACCATGMFEMGYACNRNSMFTCTDASKYIFWDSFHPTEKANHIVSDHLVMNVLKPFL